MVMDSRKQMKSIGLVLSMLALTGANEGNFLHSGCTIRRSLSNILEDSLSIYMQYPPEEGFTLTIQQEESASVMTYRDLGPTAQKPQWTAMELVLAGTPALRFQNGTPWLTGKLSSDQRLTPVPAKRVSFSNEGFLSNCPQGLPHWSIRRLDYEREETLSYGEEKVFSLMATEETRLSFSLGDRSLRLCWNDMTNSTVVLDLSPMPCQSLPPLRNLWLKFEYHSQMVQVADPSQPSAVPWSTYMGVSDLRLTFSQAEVDGIVYVVHHLKGFPNQLEGGSPRRVTNRNTADGSSVMEDNKCEVISIVTGIFAIMLILILSLLTTLFYNRWVNARQILYVLKNQKSNSDLTAIRIPAVPNRPPPNKKTVPEESNYLTPREIWDEIGDRPKSEHIYEDMVPHGWAPKSPSKESLSRENKAFERPDNHYEVPRKTANGSLMKAIGSPKKSRDGLKM